MQIKWNYIIQDSVYIKLIEYACKKCDAVMFISRKDGFGKNEISILNDTIDKIKAKYKNSFLKSRNGSYWVFTEVGNDSTRTQIPNYDDLFEILFYRTDRDIKEYLLTNKNLYSWLNPEYPEDIAFFKDGYCWLYSVAHEEYCYIFCDSEEEYNYLKSIGIEFQDSKYIPLTKEELYYEKY